MNRRFRVPEGTDAKRWSADFQTFLRPDNCLFSRLADFPAVVVPNGIQALTYGNPTQTLGLQSVQRESNPHWTPSRDAASTCWAILALVGAAGVEPALTGI